MGPFSVMPLGDGRGRKVGEEEGRVGLDRIGSHCVKVMY